MLLVALLVGIASAVFVGCVSSSDDATPTPTATASPTATPTPTPTPTVSAEQALLDLIPEDAEETLLADVLPHEYRRIGFPVPGHIFRSANPGLAVEAARAITDGSTVELTLTLAGPPTDFEWIEYWITVDLPEEVLAPSPLVLYGHTHPGDPNPNPQVYVHASNNGIFYYDAVVQQVDEVTRVVTVRMPPGWATPDSIGILVNGYLEPSAALLNVGEPVVVAIEQVDAVDTQGLGEPGPVEHLTSLPLDLGTLWTGEFVTWTHPAVRASMDAPDNWIGRSSADSFVLFGEAPDSSGVLHQINAGLSEFDAGGATASELIDQFIALGGTDLLESGRVTAPDAAPFDEISVLGVLRDFEIAPGLHPAMPDGWFSPQGAVTLIAIVVLPDGRGVFTYFDVPYADMIESVIVLLDTIRIDP